MGPDHYDGRLDRARRRSEASFGDEADGDAAAVAAVAVDWDLDLDHPTAEQVVRLTDVEEDIAGRIAAEAVHMWVPAGRRRVVDRCAERSWDDSFVVEYSTVEGLVAADDHAPGLAIAAADSLRVEVVGVGPDKARDSGARRAVVAAGDCIRRVQAECDILAGHRSDDGCLLCQIWEHDHRDAHVVDKEDTANSQPEDWQGRPVLEAAVEDRSRMKPWGSCW